MSHDTIIAHSIISLQLKDSITPIVRLKKIYFICACSFCNMPQHKAHTLLANG